MTREQRAVAEAAALIKRLGDADYQELRRITIWLAAHIHRAELVAYLLEHAHDHSFS